VLSRSIGFAFAVLIVLTVGCNSPTTPDKVGFLSDYSNLRPSSGAALRYLSSELSDYNTFIIEPVRVRPTSNSDLWEIPADDRVMLAIFFRGAIVDALADRYDITSKGGPGIARVRVAITDINKASTPLNELPQSQLARADIGGASAEFEVVDSRTGRQLAAAIDSRKAAGLNDATGWSEWAHAKSVMLEWAKRFRQRLDEGHR
jgi:hypothetical protein